MVFPLKYSKKYPFRGFQPGSRATAQVPTSRICSPWATRPTSSSLRAMWCHLAQYASYRETMPRCEPWCWNIYLHMTLQDPQLCHIYPVNSAYSWAYHGCAWVNLLTQKNCEKSSWKWPSNIFSAAPSTTFSIGFIQKRFPCFSKVYNITHRIHVCYI